MEQFENRTGMDRPVRRKKKIGLIVVAAVIAMLLVFTVSVTLVLRSDGFQYLKAVLTMESGDYVQAQAMFEEISGYQDADRLAKLCTHNLAVAKYEDKAYAESAEMFFQLGDFENSKEWYQIAAYEAGHACFMDKNYDAAWQWFDRLEGQYPENALLHFLSYEDAIAHLQSVDTPRGGQLHCFVADMPEEYRDQDYLWESASNYIFHRSGTVSYDWDEKTLYIDVVYYPSEAILNAWRTGDDTDLTDEEKVVLEKALEVVSQAKAETQDMLGTELWLHDWICDHVEYDNPNMDVPTEDYLKLRQLTCIGAMMDGKVNCQGYTDVFYLLGTMAGLDVGKLSGESEEPHTWNTVYVDDTCYLVDVTFDDMESEEPVGKTYIFFNCEFDPETYTVDGDEQLYAHVARETDAEVTYYGYNDCVFTDADDALLYMLRQYARNGKGVTYAMVADVQLDSDDVYQAVEKNMGKAGVYSVEWDEYIHCYGGNTYLTINWK